MLLGFYKPSLTDANWIYCMLTNSSSLLLTIPNICRAAGEEVGHILILISALCNALADLTTVPQLDL